MFAWARGNKRLDRGRARSALSPYAAVFVWNDTVRLGAEHTLGAEDTEAIEEFILRARGRTGTTCASVVIACRELGRVRRGDLARLALAQRRPNPWR